MKNLNRLAIETDKLRLIEGLEFESEAESLLSDLILNSSFDFLSMKINFNCKRMRIDKYCAGVDLAANFFKLPLTCSFQPLETPLIKDKCHIRLGRSKTTTTAHNWLINAMHELHTLSLKASGTAVISRRYMPYK